MQMGDAGASSRRLLLVAAAALIDASGRVLLTQRPEHKQLGGLWEFPGGKVEAGESPATALAREIREELGCTVEVGALITTTAHRYDFGIVTLTTFYCALLDGNPEAREHAAIRWVAPGELHALEWAPADVPAVHQVQVDLV